MIKSGTNACFYGPDRPGNLLFQVCDEFADHCNNNFNRIQLFKINVTCGLYASFLPKNALYEMRCMNFFIKKVVARKKMKKIYSSLKSFVVAAIRGAAKKRLEANADQTNSGIFPVSPQTFFHDCTIYPSAAGKKRPPYSRSCGIFVARMG